MNKYDIRSILRPGPKYGEKAEEPSRAIWWKVECVWEWLNKRFRSCRLSLSISVHFSSTNFFFILVQNPLPWTFFFSSSFQLWQTPHAHGERFKSQSHPRCFVHMEVVGNDQRADWLPAPTHSHTPIPLLLHVSLLRSLLLVYYKYIFIFHLTFILRINLYIFLFIILDVRITLRISSAAFRIVIYLA